MTAKTINIKSYTDWMNTRVIEATEFKSKQYLYNLWDEIVYNTPVRTGLAMFSWRMAPSVKGTFKPILQEGEGELFDPNTGVFAGFSRVFPPPEKPNLEKYKKRIYKKFVLYNNQEYVVKLNEDESKYYYQFIDDGIRRAAFKTSK